MLLAFLLFFMKVECQPDNNLNPFFRWEHITMSDGLPSPVVNCIAQDSTGFMWFGTPEGLVRYDGFHVEVFQHDPSDSSSLVHNDITCLLPDSSGLLWVGTVGGLCLVDPYTAKGKRFRLLSADSTVNPDNFIRAMLIDSKGRMWIESAGGWLCLLDRPTGKIRCWKHPGVDQVYYRYHQIYEAKNGQLWIAGRNIPPVRFDPETEEMKVFPTSRSDKRYKREQDGACYLELPTGQLLMGALDGLYSIDKLDGTVEKLHPNTTLFLLPDGPHRFWAATGAGLYRHYLHGAASDRLSHDPDIPRSLIDNHINTLFRDASGCLWAGTRQGVSKWSPAKHKFMQFGHLTGKENSLSSHRVNALAADSTSVWIGTDGTGIDRYVLSERRFVHFSQSNTPGLTGGRVKTLYIDSKGVLWAGLWEGKGFGKLDFKRNRFTMFSFDPTSQMYDWYNDFCEDELGNFYIGFWGAKGVTLFDRQRGKFGKNFWTDRQDPVVSRLTTDLFHDRLGKIWIGTSDNGFSVYNPLSDQVTNFAHSKEAYPEEGVNVVFEDSEGRIWIGGENLYRFYQAARQFVNISIWNQFPASQILAITEDRKGMLWLNTNNGLIRFNPVDYSFHHFTSNDGLQGDVFTQAACTLPDGRIAVGGAQGFNVFDPDSIVGWTFVPRIAIGRLLINGQEYIGRNPADRLRFLAHDENFITLAISVFDYNSPANIRIRYQLEGFSNQEVEVGGGNHDAVFTNIPPGKYKLTIRSTNADGQWVANSVSYPLEVADPWWNQLWFRILFVVFVGSSLFWLAKNRHEKLRIREESLELQQKLLRSRMNPHFIFNSLFAIQNFIYANSQDVAGRYLSDFALLMRRILDQSADDFIPVSQELTTLKLYLRLQIMRFPGKFSSEIFFDPHPAIQEANIPPMILQPFVENAIEHGLKNRHDGRIDIRFEFENNNFRITVSDNGIGMPRQAANASAYDRKRTHALQITRDRIALLNKKFGAEISLSFQPTNPDDTTFPGTTVVLLIPSHPKTFDLPCE
ncbi:MAG: two-component regulator propeller domain-containing protein [Bacteroidales bacterium]|nr:two-component regulator propeller domain-containing protein [Bacteroidales bacterium]